MDQVIRKLAGQVGIDASALKSADRSWAVSKAPTMVAYVLVRAWDIH